MNHVFPLPSSWEAQSELVGTRSGMGSSRHGHAGGSGEAPLSSPGPLHSRCSAKETGGDALMP